jgi:hypothetical protein
MRKRKDAIKDRSVEDLLDSLLDPHAKPSGRPIEDPWGEEYQAKLMKKEALRTIERYRKDEPLKLGLPDNNKPVTSEKMQKLKNCQNCYYCAATKKVGGSWWCQCTNPGRSKQVESVAHNWVKGRIGLPCWRER